MAGAEAEVAAAVEEVEGEGLEAADEVRPPAPEGGLQFQEKAGEVAEKALQLVIEKEEEVGVAV